MGGVSDPDVEIDFTRDGEDGSGCLLILMGLSFGRMGGVILTSVLGVRGNLDTFAELGSALLGAGLRYRFRWWFTSGTQVERSYDRAVWIGVAVLLSVAALAFAAGVVLAVVR